MEWFQAIVLGILQGLTEFLPISSSAHLRIFPELFGWGDPGAAFTAVVQIGTEAAVIVYFAKDLWRIFSTWARSLFRPELRGNFDARMGWYIIIGTLPIVVLGILLKDTIEGAFRSLWLVATMLVLLGLVLGAADRFGARTRPIKALNFQHAVLYGLAQACALIPGVSRSGASISMGLALGYDRASATRYAFLLAIPAVVGAGLYELPVIFEDSHTYGVGPTALGTVVAFVVGYASIAWLLRFVSTRSYLPFVVYRVTLGLFVMVLLATRLIQPYAGA